MAFANLSTAAPEAASCLRKKWLQKGPMAKVETRACMAPGAGVRAWYASMWRQMLRSLSTAPSVNRNTYGTPACSGQNEA